MIDEIQLENFKCLKDVTVELAPFTVLIGPNDSGKSSFLDAIRILGQTTKVSCDDVFRGDNQREKLVWMQDFLNVRMIKWRIKGRFEDIVPENRPWRSFESRLGVDVWPGKDVDDSVRSDQL